MKPNEAILVKHKDFIWATTRNLIIPSKGNDKANEILAAYNEIDPTVQVLSECSTCTNIYRDSFKIILAYCESKEWFKPKTKKNGKR